MIQPRDIKILVVDDDKELREIIATRFRAMGFDVTTAHSGHRAWDIILEKPMNIVVTDVRMPDGSGDELLKRIRKRDPNFPKVFVITGFSDFSVEEIFDMGADGLFIKPFSTQVLLDTVRKSLLSFLDQWKNQPPRDPDIKISRLFEGSLHQVGDDFQLGRGGFSLVHSDPNLKVGDMVSFEISFSAHPSLSGVAEVKWLHFDDNDRKGSVGFEFVYLEPRSKAILASWLKAKNLVAFIPCAPLKKVA